MKKILSLLLSLYMLICITACSKENANSVISSDISQTQSVADTLSDNETSSDLQTDVSANDNTSSATSTDSSRPSADTNNSTSSNARPTVSRPMPSTTSSKASSATPSTSSKPSSSTSSKSSSTTSSKASSTTVSSTLSTSSTTVSNTSSKKPVESGGEQVKHMLDGKKIIFIGDSFIYYGQVVLNGSSSRYNDKGYFYQLCKTVGANVSVTNWTYGGKGIPYIYENYMSNLTNRNYDYVVFSGGRNSASKAETYFTTLQAYIDVFTAENPNVKFLYLVSSGAHNVSVNESFPVEILNNLKEFEKMGITIVDWGKLVSDIIRENVTVPGAQQSYLKNSFVVHQSSTDGYHPNQLTGYITALMTYCAITGESAVGHSYSFWNDTSLNSKFNSANYISTYYTRGTTNYPDIFNSSEDMQGLQKLIDKYLDEKAYRTYQFSAQ